MRALAMILVLSLAVVTAPRDADALGPVDGEAGIAWWANDFDIDLADGKIDAGAVGAYASLWFFDRWGVKTAWHRSDLGDLSQGSAKYRNIDVQRRLVSITDNTWFAVGLGWQDIDLRDGIDADGPRLATDGRVGLAGIVALYGQIGWFPDLGDAGGFRDLRGRDLEFGVIVDVFPFLDVRAGYRAVKIDFKDETGSGSAKANGILLGAGVHW